MNFYKSWKHHREYAIAIVDQLEMFDGKEVTPSERIIAKQNLENLTIDLYTKIEMKRIEKEQKTLENEENCIFNWLKKWGSLHQLSKKRKNRLYWHLQ